MKRTILVITLYFVCITTWAQTQGGYVRRNNTSSKSNSKKQQIISENKKVSKTKTTTQLLVEEKVGEKPRYKITNVVGYGNTCEIYGEFGKPCLSIKGQYQVPSIIDGYRVIAIGNFAFYGCDLYKVIIPNSVLWIEERAFDGCNIEEVIMPDSLLGISKGAFQNCEHLTSLKIPDTVGYISSSSFYGCKKLSSIILPERIKNIKSYTFFGCSSLSSITIPNVLETIEAYAFDGCRRLSSITLPSTIREIGNWAFRNCGLKTVISHIQIPFKLGHDAFINIPSDAILYIPQGTKAAYDNAGWSQYFSKIVEQGDDQNVSIEKTKTNGFLVQVYAGTNTKQSRLEAEKIENEMKKKFPNLYVYSRFVSPRWICRIGGLETLDSAERVLNKVKGEGYKKALIVRGGY